MPSKISIVDKRKWLKQFEEGKQIAYIASKSQKDTRTVKKGIDDARRERDASRAVSEMLSRTLEKHNESLLSVVREIIPTLIPLSTNLIFPWKGFNGSQVLPGGKVEYSSFEPKMPKVTLDIESKLEWELLVEHLKHDPLISGVDQWKKVLAAHTWARIVLEKKLADMLASRTGYLMLDKSYNQFTELPRAPFIDPFSIVVLSGFVIDRVTEGKVEILEDKIKADGSSGEVRFGELGPVLACAPGKATECRKNIIALVRELLSSQEARNIATTYKDMTDTATKASRAAEELLLLDFIPGRCRICHRLGF